MYGSHKSVFNQIAPILSKLKHIALALNSGDSMRSFIATLRTVLESCLLYRQNSTPAFTFERSNMMNLLVSYNVSAHLLKFKRIDRLQLITVSYPESVPRHLVCHAAEKHPWDGFRPSNSRSFPNQSARCCGQMSCSHGSPTCLRVVDGLQQWLEGTTLQAPSLTPKGRIAVMSCVAAPTAASGGAVSSCSSRTSVMASAAACSERSKVSSGEQVTWKLQFRSYVVRVSHWLAKSPSNLAADL